MNGKPVFVRNIPFPLFKSSFFSSGSHFGCCKSPVPSRFNPFSLAYFSKFCSVMSFEHALEYLLCRCRSAVMFILSCFFVIFLYFYVWQDTMSYKERLFDFLVYEVAAFIAHFVYFTGIAGLLPVMPLFLTPTKIFAAEKLIWIPLLLISSSFIVLFIATRSHIRTLRALGWMTLIPGLAGVVFSFVGERRLIIFLAKLGKVEHLIVHWIDGYVPRMWLLAGVYIIIGVVLVWLSYRLEK